MLECDLIFINLNIRYYIVKLLQYELFWIGLYNTPYYDLESMGGIFYLLVLGFSRYFWGFLLAAILGPEALRF
jgi:hypothetical protein